MTNTLRIKRRSSAGAAGAPASLAAAELAFNEKDDVLYYGKGNSAGAATSILPIAGPGAFVAKSGGTMTGPLVLPTGTFSATSLNFGTAGSGLYGGTGVNFAVGGLAMMHLASATLQINSTQVSAGGISSAAAPAYSFTGALTCGLYRPGGTQISMASNGTEVQRWDAGTTTVLNGLTVSTTGTTRFTLNSPAPNNYNIIGGQKAGLTRWEIYLGDAATESGSNVGSDFSITNVADNGSTVLGVPLKITRSSGIITLTGGLILDYANPAIQLRKTASGQNASLIGMTGANQRWNLILGDLTAESATATGSNFTINSYNNSGVYYQTPFQIDRASGTTFINNGLYLLSVSNRWDTTGNIVCSTKGYQPGGGVWADSSDERIKTVLGDYTQGLAEILQLNPVRYQFKGNEYSSLAAEEAKSKSTEPISDHRAVIEKEFIGLVAQEAEVPMPEMVTKIAGFIDGQLVNDLRILDTTALIFALVNAVKELTARVEQLESPARTG